MTPRMLFLFASYLFLTCGSALAQPISVRLPADVATLPGNSISIPIEVGDLTNRDVIAYQAVITFNPNVLDATGASATGTVSGPFGPPVVNLSEKGKVSIGGFGTSPLTGSGVFITLLFDVVGQLGDTTSLVFQSFTFNSGDPPADPRNGMLRVTFATGVNRSDRPPQDFLLGQNHPNPFNPETSIPFEVPANWKQRMTLEIVNIKGQLVRTLFEGIPSPGSHRITWDSRDAAGRRVPSGPYLYRVRAGGFVAGKMMMLAR